MADVTALFLAKKIKKIIDLEWGWQKHTFFRPQRQVAERILLVMTAIQKNPVRQVGLAECLIFQWAIACLITGVVLSVGGNSLLVGRLCKKKKKKKKGIYENDETEARTKPSAPKQLVLWQYSFLSGTVQLPAFTQPLSKCDLSVFTTAESWFAVIKKTWNAWIKKSA